MNGYEKIITMMKNAPSKKQQINSPFLLGEMTSNNTCSIGDIELDEDDLLINTSLENKLEAKDTVLLSRLNEDDFIILCKVKEI